MLAGQDPAIVASGGAHGCVHLLVRDASSRFTEPHGLHPVLGEDGVPLKQQLEAHPTRFRLACAPGRDYRPRTAGGVTVVTPRTEEPAAVTCRRCRASADYAALVAAREATMASTAAEARQLAQEAAAAARQAVDVARETQGVMQ